MFSKTKGYRHESIGVGKTTLSEIGKQNGFDIDTTENSAYFNEDTLKRYRAVIFLNTTMDVLDPVQQADFKRFIESGGGFMGIHAAADTEYEWPWYGDLLGAYFKSHPKTQEAKFKKAEDSELVKNLPDEWIRTDELYTTNVFQKTSTCSIRLMKLHMKEGRMATIILSPGTMSFKVAGLFIQEWVTPLKVMLTHCFVITCYKGLSM